MIEVRHLDYDEDISLRGETLRNAIGEDRKKGKIPVYVRHIHFASTCGQNCAKAKYKPARD